VKEHLIKDFSFAEEKIRVVYNGIDVSKARAGSKKPKEEIRNSFGLSSGPVVGIVARLSDVKGHIYLIEAMRGVLDKVPGAQLLVVGEGKTKNSLVELSRRLGIEKNIFFVPKVLDTKEALSVMDVFVLPSLKEGLGLSLMEAMFAGIAAIGSDIGGIRSLIKHGENGLLVKPADVAGLSGAIIELLSDHGKNKALGERAHLFVSSNFSQEKMLSETQGVYLECLKTKS
jgi:glycosyltransferase involved in cell wall biosynthesis